MEFSKYRGCKGATQAFLSDIVDDVFSCNGHICLLLHKRTSVVVLDRLLIDDDADLRFEKQSQAEFEAAQTANVLFRSFSAEVVSVVFSIICGVLKLVVGSVDGTVYWFEWSSANCWISSFVSQVLDKGKKGTSLVDIKLEANTLICLEASSTRPNECVLTKRDCFKDQILGPPVTVCKVVCDKETARLFVTKSMHGWVLSDYGGISCVNLREVMGHPFPPNFVKDVVFCQHPLTRELAMLCLSTRELHLMKPFASPLLLCELEMKALTDCVGMCFLHHFLCVLDEGGTRCSLLDCGTGRLLKSIQSPPSSKLAIHKGTGVIEVILWGKSVGLVSPFKHDSIAKLQSMVPMARAAKMSNDWNVNRVNDIAMLSEESLMHSVKESAVLLLGSTSTPALSVALAEGMDHVEILKKIEENRTEGPQASFHRYSTLSETVNPLLEKWEQGKIERKFEHCTEEEEMMELMALENPESALDDLLKRDGESEWQFRLTCRLLFENRPKELLEFVKDERIHEVLDFLPLGLKMSRDQSIACARLLERRGEKARADRLLQGNSVDDQMIDFRLSFASAVKKEDDGMLAKLWENCDLDTVSLLKMMSVYGEFENTTEIFDDGLTIKVILEMLEKQKQKKEEANDK